ncbi:two-component system sensor histidine kinase NtrB [Psychrobacter cryohalolentis]|uniref:histidine kinase n=1 Tax=Psychrobacter cryohalolentis (strain ATCC BAA-1226 / DSM 17306 / VKM B-2378 / K5) TaxID=335284 RepID=Q1QA10_PSYCK|nr:ATP-binding protein [Psychrobacter cryohalolentis]ABE75493.1 signal transduction histidine kinase, nitrogen specific, NtrB [Psychrobacter cryohalolentis K5]ASE25684.1 two-component sensor histidine kinase [Psychrobacter cryohalolentis]
MTADFISAKPTPDLTFISQHLFTAILWVNDELSITWLNAQAEQLLAISSGRLLNQSVLMLLAPEELKTKRSTLIDSSKDKTCSLTERFFQAKQYQQPFIDHDHLINSPLNGNLSLSIDYSVTPVIYQQQNYFIIEIWGKDRQSRISEEQRQQQQYNVARHMLRSVAHEIKNPLAGIRGAAQLLQRQFIKFSERSFNTHTTDTDYPSLISSPTLNSDNHLQKTADKLRSYTDIIISETDRLTQLIGQFLGSNQLPHWQMLNVHEPIEHVLALIIHQYPQVLLQRDYDLSLPELCADKDQLIQVFLNLINNACESMTEFAQTLQQSVPAVSSQLTSDSPLNNLDFDDGYQPKLHIQTRVAFQHTIAGQQHKQVLQVAITDNGSGIHPDIIGQIFFPMVTSRALGTGLGLSIVQDIISRHHGMIDVSSTQSQGASTNTNVDNKNSHYSQTRFTLYLPFHQPIAEN